MRITAILLSIGIVSAEPVLRTEVRDGVRRADVYHAATKEPVDDQNPALEGESLIVTVAGLADEPAALVGTQTVPVVMLDETTAQFTVPAGVGGSFVELSILSAGERSNTASIPVRNAASDGIQLDASEVRTLIENSAKAVDDPRMAIAVVDRAGRPLAVFRKPQATDDTVESALSLARTGAFFSSLRTPLSSRTVRTISREHFPNDIPNQPASALFGIENTNRGCDFNTMFDPGKDVPAPKNVAGTGPSKGITTVPGGLPLFRNGGTVIGGLGVAGISPEVAEFVTVAAGLGSFGPDVPPPFAVYIDGIRLPFVNQTTRPPGTSAAAAVDGTYLVGPREGAPVPEGYLVSPKGGAMLSVSEVRDIIEKVLDRANRTRANIRLPLGTRARFVIAVTDLNGNILGLNRMPDSTIFSIDVAVTKARNVVYFSSPNADPRDLVGLPRGTAVTNRTIGFGAQSFFPSGIDDSSPGPFRELYLFDIANPCTQGRQPKNQYQSGIVFFPGSAPLYRNGVMVGGLGVSGDGVEQDDYATAGGIPGFEPPPALRADEYFIRGVRLPYFKFPRNPEQ